MITHAGEGSEFVKIIDLGVAKAAESDVAMTQTGMFVGKFRYASPDHLGFLPPDERIDGRADLYSLRHRVVRDAHGTAAIRGERRRTNTSFIIPETSTRARPISIASPAIRRCRPCSRARSSATATSASPPRASSLESLAAIEASLPDEPPTVPDDVDRTRDETEAARKADKPSRRRPSSHPLPRRQRWHVRDRGENRSEICRRPSAPRSAPPTVVDPMPMPPAPSRNRHHHRRQHHRAPAPRRDGRGGRDGVHEVPQVVQRHSHRHDREHNDNNDYIANRETVANVGRCHAAAFGACRHRHDGRDYDDNRSSTRRPRSLLRRSASRPSRHTRLWKPEAPMVPPHAPAPSRETTAPEPERAPASG